MIVDDRRFQIVFYRMKIFLVVWSVKGKWTQDAETKRKRGINNHVTLDGGQFK